MRRSLERANELPIRALARVRPETADAEGSSREMSEAGRERGGVGEMLEVLEERTSWTFGRVMSRVGILIGAGAFRFDLAKD